MEDYTPPCSECGGSCCNYIAINIDKPSNKGDYDHIRWFLTHKHVNVFIDHDKKWYVEFRTPCNHLNENNKCSIYHVRPLICQNYGKSDGECEFYNSPYSEYFTTDKQFEKYLNERKIDWKYKRKL